MELAHINSGDKQTFSARDLYFFLGYDKSNWTRWANKNIVENPFAIENEDWIGFVTMTNGNEVQDFEITIDFAKRISMMSRTEKGEEARKYFIDCEEKYKNGIKPFQLPRTYAEALRELADQTEKTEAIQRQLEAAKPKIEFFDAVTDSKDAVPMDQVAKVLNMGIGRNKMFQMLRDLGILQQNNIPYQKYVDQGYFRVIEQKYDVRGEVRISMKTLVFQKGIEFIRKKLS